MKFASLIYHKDFKTYLDKCADTENLRAMCDKFHSNFWNFWAKLYEILSQKCSVEFPALDPGICEHKWPYTTILSAKTVVYPTQGAVVLAMEAII